MKGMTMKACKRDGNQSELVTCFLDCGWRVMDTGAVGPNAIPGFPDLLCSINGHVIGVEIKQGGRQLTKDERTFWFDNGLLFPLVIVRNQQDVLKLTHRYRDEDGGSQ